MTTQRIIVATLVIILGIYYATCGVLAILMLHGMGTSAFAWVAIVSWTIMLPLGLVAIACGVGLLLLRKWSRRVWFATAAFLVLFHSAWIVADYRATREIGPLIPALVIVGFCIASSLFLKSHAAEHLFS